MPYTLEPVAILRSPFTDKFGIPRQPGLAPSARGTIEMLAPYHGAEAVRGLEGFSHIWITFLFHRHIDHPVSTTVRPPRLGGNQRLGVFATRSSFRPNPIGQSAVKLVSIQQASSGTVLTVSGIDILDHTPVIDIKPYIPYSDSLPEARGGFADHAPAPTLSVDFDPSAKQQLQHLSQEKYPALQQLIIEVLRQDPRPAYKKGDSLREYGLHLYDLNIRFQVNGSHVIVIEIAPPPR